MVQGTTSDAGKSTLVTAICRWLKLKGRSVAPFKPQNMALNSAVTENGGEIGRAQAVQALACGLSPHTDMNPILLKPNSDIGSQVIIHGQAIGNMNAMAYHEYKSTARNAALESFSRLAREYEAVIVEGAGSPAEINLRANDIANMGFAEAVDCPVILVADIDRGGVFAHLVGTLALLSESEQARVAGFVINRFRGDIKLLQPGLDWLQERTGKPVIGVLPYLHDLHLEAEDSLSMHTKQPTKGDAALNVVVPVTPRLSNHTDFDALRLHPQVNLTFARDGALPTADLIILGGSKSVRADLEFLRGRGWEESIKRHLRYGGKLLGICGGFQMLGRAIHDPQGMEGTPGTTRGLALLDMETTLHSQKGLRNVRGKLLLGGTAGSNAELTGYEIHAGISSGTALRNPFSMVATSSPSVADAAAEHCAATFPDGAVSEDGQVAGTYLHGVFDSPEACRAILGWAGAAPTEQPDYRALVEKDINRLAELVEKHLDTELLMNLCGFKV